METHESFLMPQVAQGREEQKALSDSMVEVVEVLKLQCLVTLLQQSRDSWTVQNMKDVLSLANIGTSCLLQNGFHIRACIDETLQIYLAACVFTIVPLCQPHLCLSVIMIMLLALRMVVGTVKMSLAPLANTDRSARSHG